MDPKRHALAINFCQLHTSHFNVFDICSHFPFLRTFLICPECVLDNDAFSCKQLWNPAPLPAFARSLWCLFVEDIARCLECDWSNDPSWIWLAMCNMTALKWVQFWCSSLPQKAWKHHLDFLLALASVWHSDMATDSLPTATAWLNSSTQINAIEFFENFHARCNWDTIEFFEHVHSDPNQDSSQWCGVHCREWKEGGKSNHATNKCIQNSNHATNKCIQKLLSVLVSVLLLCEEMHTFLMWKNLQSLGWLQRSTMFNFNLMCSRKRNLLKNGDPPDSQWLTARGLNNWGAAAGHMQISLDQTAVQSASRTEELSSGPRGHRLDSPVQR